MTIKHNYSGKSLAELKQENPTFFYDQSWYENEKWFTNKLAPAQYEIKFEPKLNNLNYAEQKAKLKKGFNFIHPAVLIEALIEHYKKTGERLMQTWWSRCSVVDSRGYHVFVGFFDSRGLGVDSYYDNGRDGILGLSSSQKLKSLKPKDLEPTFTLEEIKKLKELCKILK